MRILKTSFVYILKISLILSMIQVATASSDIHAIEMLIEKYSKEVLIDYILKNKNNTITLLKKDELVDFIGLPDPIYVTPETILSDFEEIGITSSDFVEMENRSRLQKVKSSETGRGERRTVFSEYRAQPVELYQAAYASVVLRSGPSFHSHEIGRIPRGTSVEVLEQKSHWVKVELESAIGWAPIAVELVEEEPERRPELLCSLYGTQFTRNRTYKSFITVQNVGNGDFKGSLTIYAFGGNRIVFYGFHHFHLDPVKASERKTIFLETRERVTSIKTEYD